MCKLVAVATRACRNGCVAGLIFLALAIAAPGTADDQLSPRSACKPVEYALGDCSCVAAFLDRHVGPQHAAALMFAWSVAALHRRGEGSTLELYSRYSPGAVNAAVQAFFLHRDELASTCARLGPMLEEEL